MSADYRTLLGLVREFVESPEIEAHTDAAKELVKRARAAIEPSKPKNDTAIVHTHVSDACCSKPIMKAMRKGLLDDKAQWTCPKCDTDWRMEVFNAVHHWMPVPAMAVFRT